MVSHDMRTPLFAIQGTTELLAYGTYGTLPERANEQLEVILRNCARLMHLINDLLDLEKLEAGQLELRIKPIDGSAIVNSAAEALNSFAVQKLSISKPTCPRRLKSLVIWIG